jgi:hypothetical protein
MAIFASGNVVHLRPVCANAEVAREPIIKIILIYDMVVSLPG